jgi:hypothetical protein
VCQQFEDGAGHERSALHVTRRCATTNWRPGEISADHRLPGLGLRPLTTPHKRGHRRPRVACW